MPIVRHSRDKVEMQADPSRLHIFAGYESSSADHDEETASWNKPERDCCGRRGIFWLLLSLVSLGVVAAVVALSLWMQRHHAPPVTLSLPSNDTTTLDPATATKLSLHCYFGTTPTVMSESSANAARTTLEEWLAVLLSADLIAVDLVDQQVVLEPEQRRDADVYAAHVATEWRVNAQTTLANWTWALTHLVERNIEDLRLAWQATGDAYFGSLINISTTPLAAQERPLITLAPAPVRANSTDNLVCNGAKEFCHLPVNEYLWAIVHNAMAAKENGVTVAASQLLGLESAVEAGFRGLNLDLGWCDGQLRFLHSYCWMGTREPVEVLTYLDNFLANHPGEVLLLPMEINNDGGEVTIADMQTMLDSAGNFSSRLYAHHGGADWPSLGELVADDRRVILFHYNGESCNTTACPPGFHDWFSYATETPFTMSSMVEMMDTNYSCARTRGKEGLQSFYGLNMFFDIPSESASAEMNAAAFVEAHLEDCEDVTGLEPNLLIVDFWNIGDVLEVAWDVNEARAMDSARQRRLGETPCNGLVSNCGLRANEILYATAHNAMASADKNVLFPNHRLSLEQAVEAGFRGINIDIGKCNGELRLVHSYCFLNSRDPMEVFQNLNRFLDENPNEILIMPVEIVNDSGGDVTLTEIHNLLVMAGNFNKRLHVQRPGRKWPKLRKMIRRNKRVIFFHYNGEQASSLYPGLLNWFDFASETRFTFNTLAEVENTANSCQVTRGLTGTKDFFGVNLFLQIPSAVASTAMNAESFLQTHLSACSNLNQGMDVNLILVDFWEIGKTLEVVNAHNAALARR